jgi:hypothetical protein
MISQESAETLCVEFVSKYLKDATPCTAEDIANMLMKLVSVAGVTMYRIVGQEETMKRMIQTAAFCCRLPVPDEIVVEKRPKTRTKH